MPTPTTVLFVTNDAWYFVSHRLPIAEAVVRLGWRAVVVAREDDAAERIRAAGVEFVPWRVSPRGRSPLGDLRAFLQLGATLRGIGPDVLHLVTIKPVLYGGLLARALGVPTVVYAVAGVGAVFQPRARLERLLAFVVTRLYRAAVGHPVSVMLFQNSADRDYLFERLAPLRPDSALIRGSGVDPARYHPGREPVEPPLVVLAARLLRDKGIVEFATAAARLRDEGSDARFAIAGGQAGQGNPAAMSPAEIDALAERTGVELLGSRDDIPELFAQASLVVLPSWREGLPKVLVEAGAAARAIVTTDVPGCRDAIEPGVSGLLVPKGDVDALAGAMRELLGDPGRRAAMGRAGRRLVERSMTVEEVVSRHLTLYRSLLSRRRDRGGKGVRA